MSEFEDYILDVGGSLDFSSGNFIDNGKGLFLTKKEIEVLDNYGISYQNYKSLNELVCFINNYLNQGDDCDDLMEILISMSERDYYLNVNN